MDKNTAYKESNIILDNEDYLIVEPKTFSAANYFLNPYDRAEERPFKSMLSNYYFYIIIHKNAEGHRYHLRINKSSGVAEFKDVTENEKIDYKQFIFQLTPIENDILELIGKSDLYRTLRYLKSGRLLSDYDVERTDYLIRDVKILKRSPLGSRVILQFDLDDYLDLFDMEDYDKRFCQSMLGGYYGGGWDFNLNDRIWEDFKEGYFFRNFNDENLKKLAEIANLINPDVNSEEILDGNENALSKVAYSIRELKGRYEDDLTSPYYDVTIDCYTESGRDTVRDEICGVLTEFGFFIKEDNCYSTYYTTLGNILKLYENSNLFSANLHGLLKHYVRQYKESLSFEEESYGECHNKHWTTEIENQLQEKFSNALDSILDDILDNEEFVNIEELRNTIKEITKKFEFGRWYELPKDDTKQIQFVKVDPKTNLIHYRSIDKEKGDGIKNGRGTLEDINLVLYHPEIDFK